MKIKGDKTTLQIIEFTIRKPYWQQSWFVILLLSSLLILFFFIYQYRISILSKKKNLEIEKITLENHLNENRLKLIKAQMNPHFFFNALNTIQSFIATNETEEATSYLDNFSKLTRLILEMTDKNTISIEEEIKMQNLYLSLQKIRLNDFEFEIKCEPKCLERAQIPTMLIQPYIENAIIHGLSHKKGTKKLKISFVEIENNKLEIVVLDNGIGIKKANEINSKSKTKSASFATKATLERIEIINRNNFTIVIETNEIIENEISRGTEVKIKMNLAYESL
jgi:LytS/YehU family sensor histidine kinase